MLAPQPTPTGAIAAAIALSLLSAPAAAQIVPDASLPDNSRVSSDGNTLTIDGGTTAGENLFHSFDRFSVPSGSAAHFNNATSIQNIFSRVTGSLPSDIDGTLRANGTANLFLLNPNGIIFGENAQLDLGGSFYASSGEFIEFADGSRYSALTAPSSPLSVSVPVGLGLGSQPGAIANRSRVVDAGGNPLGLQVQPGQTLAFIGGNLDIAGGYATAADGQIDLVALSDATWNLERRRASQPGTGAIVLRDGAIVDVSGNAGGDLQVWGDRLQVSNSALLLSDTLGDGSGRGIDIQVRDLTVTRDGIVSTSNYGSGQAGALTVRADRVTLDGNAQLQDFLPRLFALEEINSPQEIGTGLYATTFSDGSASQVNIDAREMLLRDSSFISTATRSAGAGGTVNASVRESVVLSGSQIVAETTGSGNAGAVNLTAPNILINEGGGIFVSTFGLGDGGTVNLRADIIDVVGGTPDGQFNSGLGANAFPDAVTRGGVLNIIARQFIVRDGGGIGTVTFGAGQAGIVIIRASELVEIVGIDRTRSLPSNISSRSESSGAAGDIEITTARLVLRDGGSVINSTSSSGAAGRITIRASESVEIDGLTTFVDREGNLAIQRSGLQSNATLDRLPSALPPSEADTLGAAGDVTAITPEFSLRNGAQIVVSSIGEGERGGNFTLESSRVTLENGAQVVAETASDLGGNIEIRASDLRLLDNSFISTNATGTAAGGNISITTDTLVALDNSDITANAEQGLGGQARVEALAVFGTQVRDRLTPESDITATSQLGADFSGSAEITNPDVQLDSSLVELSSDFIPVDRLVADSCLTRDREGGQFTVTGTGGLPETPDSASVGRYSLSQVSGIGGVTADDPTPQTEMAADTTAPTWQLGDPIQEARGLRTADGRILLGNPTTRDRPCGVTAPATPIAD